VQQKPTYGRMYQTPFADRIRNEAGIATIAVGAISEADHVNSIIAAGRADLCAVARPHLANPSWTLERGGQDRLHRDRLASPIPHCQAADGKQLLARARGGDGCRARGGEMSAAHSRRSLALTPMTRIVKELP
jgi:anthraniloyl-CoA monooxygenase